MILNPSCSEIVTSFRVKDIDEARSAIDLISKELGMNLFLTIHFTSFEVDEKNKKLVLVYETSKDYLNYKTFALPFDSKHLRLRKKESFDKDRNKKIKWYEYYFDKDIFKILTFDIDLPEISDKKLENMTLIFKNCHIMPQLIQESSEIIFNTKKEMICLNGTDEDVISQKKPNLFNYSIDEYDCDKFPFFSKIVKLCKKYGGENENHYSTTFQNWCSEDNNNLELLVTYAATIICFNMNTLDNFKKMLVQVAHRYSLYLNYFEKDNEIFIKVDLSKLKINNKKGKMIYGLSKFNEIKKYSFYFIKKTNDMPLKKQYSVDDMKFKSKTIFSIIYNPSELTYPFAIMLWDERDINIEGHYENLRSHIIRDFKPYLSEIRFFGDEFFRKHNPTINLMESSDKKEQNIFNKIKKHLKR